MMVTGELFITLTNEIQSAQYWLTYIMLSLNVVKYPIIIKVYQKRSYYFIKKEIVLLIRLLLFVSVTFETLVNFSIIIVWTFFTLKICTGHACHFSILIMYKWVKLIILYSLVYRLMKNNKVQSYTAFYSSIEYAVCSKEL